MLMLLITHIIIALASLGFTAYTMVNPSASKLKGAYGLATLTLVSGTLLVVDSPTHLAQACISGIVFTGLTLAGTRLARGRLVTSLQ